MKSDHFYYKIEIASFCPLVDQHSIGRKKSKKTYLSIIFFNVWLEKYITQLSCQPNGRSILWMENFSRISIPHFYFIAFQCEKNIRYFNFRILQKVDLISAHTRK